MKDRTIIKAVIAVAEGTALAIIWHGSVEVSEYFKENCSDCMMYVIGDADEAQQFSEYERKPTSAEQTAVCDLISENRLF